MSRPIFTTLAVALLPCAGWAEAPRVVADIPPVQSLVARVMQGVAEPALLIRPGASPHGYQMKPSEAAALDAAQAVFFVGPELTPWIERPLQSLATDAVQVELLAAPGTVTLATRSAATFGGHDDAGAAPGGGMQGAGRDAAGTDGPARDDAAADGHDHAHDHGGIDPHAWLDPENGKAWLAAIADELARLDPPNAATYAENARAGAVEIDAAAADTQAVVASLGPLRFLVFHDAYQYFENRFGLTAAGAVSVSDASTPSPARIAELQQAVATLDVTCALAEPQFDADLVTAVTQGHDVRTAVLDPVGAALPPGPQMYPELIRSIGAALKACR